MSREKLLAVVAPWLLYTYTFQTQSESRRFLQPARQLRLLIQSPEELR